MDRRGKVDPEKEAIKLVEELTREIQSAEEIELEDVELEIGDLEIAITNPVLYVYAIASSLVQHVVQQVLQQIPGLAPLPAPLVKFELERVTAKTPEIKWVGRVVEVKIGNRRGEGGTREVTYIIGGATTMPLYGDAASFKPPVLSMDVFDMKIPLPRAVREAIGEDVLDNPPEWARLCIEKFGADMVNIHLVSTDPKLQDAPPSRAVKVVEEILQAVKTPIFIGGSGNPQKDLVVLKEIAEHFSGERLLISPITLDMKLDEIAPVIKKCNHVAVGSVTMDIDKARQLTRKLTTWLSPEDITIDLFGAAIGYGWEYSFTIIERARLAALSGDRELQYPFVIAASNAWAAREAWMRMDEFWGPREVRGPLWEYLTALTMTLAGADLLLTLHPLTVKLLKITFEHMKRLAPSNEDKKAIEAWLKPSG